jgi:hypothetical protein
MNKLEFIKALWSPFKPFKLKWYCGKVAIGTPYFFPRKWVKDLEKPGYQKAIPKKIGFDFVGLGWKTKWTEIDYRFEWAPIWSFVFFKWQMAIIFIAPEQHHYWETWLYYERNTNKFKSKEERIKDCIKNFPLNYIVHRVSKKEYINYYNLILKNGYKYLITN